MHYVYGLFDDTGKPFYIGKGNKERLAVQRRGGDKKNRPVSKRIKWLRSRGRSHEVRVLFETEDQAEAFRKEQEWIAHYGIRNLVNVSIGGKGTFGVKQSDAQKQACSKRFKGISKSESQRKNISEGKKGKSFTPEHRANISKVRKGKPLGPRPWEYRVRMSELVKEKLRLKREAAGNFNGPKKPQPNRSHLKVNPGEIISTPTNRMAKRLGD